MDENKLKDILGNIEAPEANENARKRAVNLAMAEFKTHQNEKTSKKFQGNSFFARLMGKSTETTRRDSMEQRKKNKLVFGGMATAMAVVLVAGISFTQLQDHKQLTALTGSSGAGAKVKAAELNALSFNVGDGQSAPTDSRANESALVRQRADTRSETRAPAVEHELAEESIAMSDMATEAMPMPSAVPTAPVLAKKAERKVMGGMAQGLMAPEADMIMPMPVEPQSRDKFAEFEVNPIKLVSEEPVSTFSADVDTASYSFVRKQILQQGRLPNPDSVRVEELINYFDYNYPLPETREKPFKPTVTLVHSPFNPGKQLMHIGIKGFDVQGEQPKSNIVFLLDVSGSMNQANKLPLVKDSMKMLLDSLKPDDTVAIAVYAGAAGTVLEPTPVSERSKIYEALNKLSAGGSTAGGAGIELAYNLAAENFDEDAVNRVILATDGDFNVGVSNHEELKKIIEQKREKGIFLSVLGFGQGNLNDRLMQTLAQNGNGVAAYIDSISEARKVLIDEATSTLFPIAKDVKFQVEFNPKAVAEYRLIGYETRALNREDFNNDKVDAGDIGAGHTVTAIYEITPVGSEAVSVDPLRYAEKAETPAAEDIQADTDFGNEIAFLKMRYKLPNEDTSNLITTPITNEHVKTFCTCPEGALCEACAPQIQPSKDVQFSIAVAGFGELLKGSKHTGTFSYDDVIELAKDVKGDDRFGYRVEFINMVRNAKVFANR